MNSDLIDPHHTRRDLRRLESAVQRGWVIPETLYENLARHLAQIVARGRDREKIAAARVLVAMNDSNSRNRPTPVMASSIVIDLGPVTEHNVEQHRASRLAGLAGDLSD